MDPVAFVVGNVLLGNPDNAAAIEVQTFPFVVRFLADTNFAVTGADTAATLDDHDVPPWWSATARRGQTLTLRPPASGARAYLALAGGIDVPVILGSRSTHLRSEFGGFGGRSLEQGDVLRTLDWRRHQPLEIGRPRRRPAGLCAAGDERPGPACPRAEGWRVRPVLCGDAGAVLGDRVEDHAPQRSRRLPAFRQPDSSSRRRSSCAPTGWSPASSRCRRPASRSSS